MTGETEKGRVPLRGNGPEDPGGVADFAMAHLRLAFRATGLAVPTMVADDDLPAFGPAPASRVQIASLPSEAALEIAELMLAGGRHRTECLSRPPTGRGTREINERAGSVLENDCC